MKYTIIVNTGSGWEPIKLTRISTHGVENIEAMTKMQADKLVEKIRLAEGIKAEVILIEKGRRNG